jgi:hypothetical protein
MAKIKEQIRDSTEFLIMGRKYSNKILWRTVGKICIFVNLLVSHEWLQNLSCERSTHTPGQLSLNKALI